MQPDMFRVRRGAAWGGVVLLALYFALTAGFAAATWGGGQVATPSGEQHLAAVETGGAICTCPGSDDPPPQR